MNHSRPCCLQRLPSWSRLRESEFRYIHGREYARRFGRSLDRARNHGPVGRHAVYLRTGLAHHRAGQCLRTAKTEISKTASAVDKDGRVTRPQGQSVDDVDINVIGQGQVGIQSDAIQRTVDRGRGCASWMDRWLDG